jgi:peptidoglycan/xylan/chitin deacetylase (PgdA/CDA1 family)
MLKSWLKSKLSFLKSNSWVLMYHRINDPDIDPWNISVSKEKFEEQIIWLKQHCHVLPLYQLISDWRNGHLKKHSVAITFDDGYIDNYTTAVPLLEKHSLPATFFICTDYLFQQKPFWWDELAGYILQSDILPEHFSIKIEDIEVAKDLKDEAHLNSEVKRKNYLWRYPQPPPTLRGQLYLELWGIFRKQNDAQRAIYMLRIQQLASLSTQWDPELMDVKCLHDIAKNSLFNIEAHTCSHPALQYLPVNVQYDEIAESKRLLAETFKIPVRFLAYPYGSYDNFSFEASLKAGLEACFTTQPVPVNKSLHKYQVGRMMMTNEINFRMQIR